MKPHGQKGVFVYFSPDGLRWRQRHKTPSLVSTAIVISDCGETQTLASSFVLCASDTSTGVWRGARARISSVGPNHA